MKTITIEKTPTTFLLPATGVQAVHAATSKEETRYYLRGVFCHDTGAGITLAATDGHIMLNLAAPKIAFIGESVFTQSGEYDVGFILSIDTMDKAFKAKTIGERWLYGDTETGIVQVIDFAHDETEHSRVGVVEFERIDGTFPDYQRVKPEPCSGEKYCPINVDPDLIARLNKGYGFVKPDKTGAMSFAAENPGDPVAVRFRASPDLTGVIMPIRM